MKTINNILDFIKHKLVFLPLLLILMFYFSLADENLKTIFAGIAIFILGMNFMESGFKLFSGDSLEKLISTFTSSKPRSMFMGFISTSIVQSSSLISIILISFLSIKIISLAQAIAVIFGANLGSTTTAWLISFFGLKLNISSYAMPMIVFGVIFTLFKTKVYEAFGNVLLGLGFVFLAIFYMKNGFEGLQGTIDLSSYSLDGLLGFIVFCFVGAIITLIMQSSGASMALIITALALNQITYDNAIALTIGVNIGTPFTAVLASITSNMNGKRLALVHLVFNFLTAFFVSIFLFQILGLIEIISEYFHIKDDNYIIKLSLFHTIFNLFGLIIMSPFIGRFEQLSRYIIKDKVKAFHKPKYISNELVDVPLVSIKALEKELVNLYLSSHKIILHTISLNRTEVFSKKDLKKIVKHSISEIYLDNVYTRNIKYLYEEIIKFASLSQKYMDKEEIHKVFKLKIAAKEILNAIKEVKSLQKNILIYLDAKNEFIRKEYNILRLEIANCLKQIDLLTADDLSYEDKYIKISKLNERVEKLDIIGSGKIDDLIRQNKINAKMASSLISDSLRTYHICKKLVFITNIIFLKENEFNILEKED